MADPRPPGQRLETWRSPERRTRRDSRRSSWSAAASRSPYRRCSSPMMPRRRRIRCPARGRGTVTAGIRLPWAWPNGSLHAISISVSDPSSSPSRSSRSAADGTRWRSSRRRCASWGRHLLVADPRADDDTCDRTRRPAVRRCPRQDGGTAHQILQIDHDQHQRAQQARAGRGQARYGPATASSRDGRGRSTPAPRPMWRSAGRRTRPL